MSVIEQLKRFTENSVTDVLEVVELLAGATAIRSLAESKNVPIPEYVDDAIRSLNRVIAERTRDARELRLKELRAQETTLLTASEKRERIAAERAKLEAELQGV